MITERVREDLMITDHVDIYWLPKEKIVVKGFTGYVKGKEFRDAFTAGINKLKQEKTNKWLSLNKEAMVFKADDIKWVEDNWTPVMYKLKWTHWAIVEPADFNGKMPLDYFTKKYAMKGIETKVFGDYDEVVDWLASK